MQKFVMPGDKLGVEEEYMPGENAFVDESDGSIRAAIMGVPEIKDGKILVSNPNQNIVKVTRGMFVLGTITDSMKSVMFVKIDRLQVGNREFLPLKDGKIVMESRMRGPPRGRDGPPDRSDGPRPPREEPAGKPAGVGDVVLAKVLFEDPEIYTLVMNDKDTGVVHATCELCGGFMKPSGQFLVCGACENKQAKKVSPLYDQPEAIKRLFA